ncbi:hypothetical protein DASB73_014980 [Starmerella bacillaris]|uniref:ABM domain-containing protein n=1 Tax=Starmerella bacillaris TaxID=1247836 RepID=A0AAV5RGI3_STABA|nr:hypothetical protein DASB73_014980 [Starmerella bacillaris]
MAKSLYAQIEPAAGHEDFVKNAITEYAKFVRSEPGNVRFEVYLTEKGLLHIEETYKDEAAFQAHIGYPENKKFNDSIIGKVAGGASSVYFLTPLSVTF